MNSKRIRITSKHKRGRITHPVIYRLDSLAYQVSIGLMICLPFLVPFTDARNIDLQGLILLLAGLTSLLVTLNRQIFSRLGQREQILLGIFGTLCLFSMAVNPHWYYNFFGAPYIRLGVAGLLSCIACGLVLGAISTRRLITSLYWLICLVAIVSIPYNWLRFHSFLRIGGVFAQTDIFAVFLACGLLLGLTMTKSYPHWRWPIRIIQFGLASLLILTQTRAVLLLVVILYVYIFWQSRQYKKWSNRKWAICVSGVLCVLIGAKILLPARLTNVNYASQSIQYRFSLQRYALDATMQKPFFGYGPGNLADALACNKLTATSLQKTCHAGYFFNSSHNIFLDRVLAIGWIGGLAFLLFVLIELRSGLGDDSDTRILTYCALLIACYYLTNVTNITLELLLWILLIHIALQRSVKQSI